VISSRLRQIGSVVGWLSVPATGAAMATLIVDRTLIFWPGLEWGLTFLVSTVAIAAVWLAVERLTGPWSRVRLLGSGIPLLLLADAWLVLGFAYLDGGTNHMLAANLLPGNLIVEPDLQGYLVLKFAVLVVARLLVRWWDWADSPPARDNQNPAAPAPNNTFLLLIVVLLAGLYIRTGVLDMLAIEVPSDFRVNFVAARALVDGLNPYDNAVALAVAGREGIPYVGGETWTVVTNPPTAMPYFALFTGLSFDSARVAFLFTNQLLLLVTGFLLYRLARPARPLLWLASMLVLAVAFEPLLATLRLGQVDILIALLLSLAVLAERRRLGWLAGAAVGLAAAFKLAPALLVLYFVWRRDWRAVGGMAVAGLVAVAISLAFVGTYVWSFSLTERLPDLLAGTGLWNNLSLPGLVNRYALGPSQGLSYWGTLPSIPLAGSLGYFASAAVLLVTATSLRRRPPPALSFGLATAALLLISGVTWPHYTLWLLPVVAWLAAGRSWPDGRRRRLIVGVLFGLGAVLISLPLPDYQPLFGDLYAASVTIMSVRNLGLVAVFGALVLLSRTSPSDQLESNR
jgi:alpha-1,2-mannosyltransferase